MVLSIVELFLSGNAAFSAFRAFRLARVIQLARKAERLRKIVNVLASAMAEAIYLFMLLLIFLFIYTILGMQLYGTDVCLVCLGRGRVHLICTCMRGGN